MLYGLRRTLLRSRHRLGDRGWARIEAAFAADDELALECAWVGKEAFCDVYAAADRATAKAALDDWYDLVERYDVGDHTIFLGEIVSAGSELDADPLLWFASGYRRIAPS